jgi:APA family basic amino acid/polyamine antiporter
MTAALSYGELAAAMPQAGGQYVYLRESFGRLSGFLYGWTLFLVIQTGTIAAVAVAFAKFAGIFAPRISAQNYLLPYFSTQQLAAIAVLVLLTWVNTRGLRSGAAVQNVFTIAKVGSLAGFIVLGLVAGRNPAAMETNFQDFWRNADWTMTAVRVVGVAMVGALFSADAWNNVTFTAGEVRNPQRNLPLSLALGVGTICALYIACNFIYLSLLPLDAIQHAAEDRVATAAAAVVFGDAARYLMAGAIVVSTFGCINGMVLAGARVYYAMALDGLFFSQVGRLDHRFHTPTTSLVVQCTWACLLTLTGTYSDLLDYVIFAVLLFYILTIAGIFVLRVKRPEMERPYKAIGYPVLPALYIVLAGAVEILLLIYKPSYTWPGLLIVLLGIPVYFYWQRREVKA